MFVHLFLLHLNCLLFPPSQKLLHSVQPPLSPLWRCTKTKQDSNSDQNKKNKKQKQALDISPVPSVPHPPPPSTFTPSVLNTTNCSSRSRAVLLSSVRLVVLATQSRHNPSCHHYIHANRQTHTCVSPPSPPPPPPPGSICCVVAALAPQQEKSVAVYSGG